MVDLFDSLHKLFLETYRLACLPDKERRYISGFLSIYTTELCNATIPQALILPSFLSSNVTVTQVAISTDVRFPDLEPRIFLYRRLKGRLQSSLYLHQLYQS